METGDSDTWVLPLTIGVGVGLITIFLAFVGRQVFNWWLTRIILKSKPTAEISLMRRTAGYDKPTPMIQVNLFDIDIFTKQRDGQYWMMAELILPNKKRVKFKRSKNPYTYFMDLTVLGLDEKRLTDWGFWENDGEMIKQSKLTAVLFINDRECVLTRNQKPTVKFLEQ